MTYTKKNDEAVSPVIGVILMVAITVILAAVIAAFVFGMAGNVSKAKVVAYTAQRAGDTTVAITCMGGQDVGTLNTIAATQNGASATVGSATAVTVGSSTYVTVDTNPAKVVIIGTFDDGTQQILLDTII